MSAYRGCSFVPSTSCELILKGIGLLSGDLALTREIGNPPQEYTQVIRCRWRETHYRHLPIKYTPNSPTSAFSPTRFVSPDLRLKTARPPHPSPKILNGYNAPLTRNQLTAIKSFQRLQRDNDALDDRATNAWYRSLLRGRSRGS